MPWMLEGAHVCPHKGFVGGGVAGWVHVHPHPGGKKSLYPTAGESREQNSIIISFFLSWCNETCMPTKDGDIITHSYTSGGCVILVISKLGNKIWGLKF